MRRFARKMMPFGFALIVVAGLPEDGRTQSLSDRICTAVQAHLSRATGLEGPMFLATTRLNGATWQQVSARFSSAAFGVAQNVDYLYVAYVRPRTFEQAGAISLRIAVPAGERGHRTNRVEIYRPAIAAGTNRCEPRGRYRIDTTVRLNQYIDYHDPAGGRANSALEDFHLSYPVQSRGCTRTDRGLLRSTFAFGSDVTRTQGDTVAGRYLRFVSPAYGVTHAYARLRSELHYRPAAQLNVACIGFTIPLDKNPAAVTVRDHGFGSIWTPDRTLTIER
jgi:hypothetical protein